MFNPIVVSLSIRDSQKFHFFQGDVVQVCIAVSVMLLVI
jgi:hypothetical protein